jgi:alpha-tubulin suppressor-like RCC1 family protein
MKIDTTKLGYRWKGAYADGVNYEKGDVVRKDGKVVSWNGYSWTQMASDQINATQRGEIATPDENQTLVGVEGMDLYAGDGSLEWKYSDGRKITAVARLPELPDSGDCYAAGSGQTMSAIMTDGTVRVWGRNANGLGTGYIADYDTPVPVQAQFPKGTAPIVKLWQGYWSHYALDAQGQLWAWGYNNYGQLGVGSTSNVGIPTLVNGQGDLPANATVVDVAVGQGYYSYSRTLIKTSDGRVYFCGHNNYGIAGVGDNANRSVPTLVLRSLDIEVEWMTISGHYYGASWLVTPEGHVWGSGQDNAIGNIRNNGDPADAKHELGYWSVEDPIAKIYMEESDEHVTAGDQYYRQYMMISKAGNVWSWGHGSTYSSGTNLIQAPGAANTWAPHYDPRISNVVSGGVSGGWYNTAHVVKSDGTVWAIGASQDSASYPNSNTSEWLQLDTSAVTGTNKLVNIDRMYFSGARHGKTAAYITKDGKFYQMGMNDYGSSGDGWANQVPYDYAILPGPITQFYWTGWCYDSANQHACFALTGDGNAYHWGYGSRGVSGRDLDGNHGYTPSPVIF